MPSLYGTAATGTLVNVDANARKLVGDGASGVGPYTSLGTPQLQALKIVSSAYDFTTTPTISNSILWKAVTALQSMAEVYYVGKPTATGTNNFVALVNVEKNDSGNGYGALTSMDGTYTNMEAVILAALGGSGTVTITEVALTGLTFA